MRVHAVEICELGSRLSEYVHLAAAGDRVLVTEGERIVAELSAPRAESVLAAATVEPVHPGAAPPPSTGDPGAPATRRAIRLADILKDLDCDRAER